MIRWLREHRDIFEVRRRAALDDRVQNHMEVSRLIDARAATRLKRLAPTSKKVPIILELRALIASKLQKLEITNLPLRSQEARKIERLADEAGVPRPRTTCACCA